MRLSRDGFTNDARLLCQAFQAINEDDDSLTQWVLKGDVSGPCGVYLTHPAILRKYEQQHIDDDAACDVYVQDDTVLLVDPDAVPPKHQQTAEWSFSIVYSDTWMVPVLYFTVKHMDGTPYLRSEVLKLLNVNEDDVADTWDFLSYEEHPVTGEPCFFLHPCQTSERLGQLQPMLPLLSWAAMILPAVGQRISTRTFTRVQKWINDNGTR